MADTPVEPQGTDPTHAEGTTSNADPAPVMHTRMSIVDQLAAQREAQFSDESGIDLPPAANPDGTPNEGAPGDGAPTEGAPNEGAPTEGDAQLAAQLGQDARYMPPEFSNRLVKLRIDGQDVEVPFEQLVRDAQRSAAASNRLNDATRLLEEARLERELAARERANAGGAAPAQTVPIVNPSPSENPPAEAVRAKVKDALSSVFAGDEDAAAAKLAEALTSIVPRVEQPKVDVNAITQTVARQLEEDSALQSFFGTYQRIAELPYLQSRTDQILNGILAAEAQRTDGDPRKSFAQALKDAGDAVYRELGWEPPAPPAAVPNPPATTRRTQDVSARKANLDVPTARTVSASTVQAPADSSEDDRAQTVAEMAARRSPVRVPDPGRQPGAR